MPRMSSHAPIKIGLASLALALTSTLAACGGDDDSTPTTGSTASTSATPTASPSLSESASPSASDTAEAGGTTIDGTGYSFEMPKGWHEQTKRFQAINPQVDRAAASTDVSVGYADNVNVIRTENLPEMTADQAEKALVAEVKRVATDVEVQPRREIDGVESLHITGRTTVAKVKVRTEQFASYVDKTWYIITFSFSPKTPDAERQQQTESILDSWHWA